MDYLSRPPDFVPRFGYPRSLYPQKRSVYDDPLWMVIPLSSGRGVLVEAYTVEQLSDRARLAGNLLPFISYPLLLLAFWLIGRILLPYGAGGVLAAIFVLTALVYVFFRALGWLVWLPLLKGLNRGELILISIPDIFYRIVNPVEADSFRHHQKYQLVGKLGGGVASAMVGFVSAPFVGHVAAKLLEKAVDLASDAVVDKMSESVDKPKRDERNNALRPHGSDDK